ncbi:mandelate racemase [Bradyrhizobium sp. USDA 3686]|uniref:enolase C-terminal domain-like protein n=1 Tax=Bradyrhizobium canariense TaxID=255045 RepID=UPI0019582D51|nr:enolase C-terminal domain-like protein [Bradyrhizobium canariense]
MTPSEHLVRSLKVRTCVVPLDPEVQTASGRVPVAPLVLIDLETDAGMIGSSYIFTYTPVALKPTAELVRGMEVVIKGRPLAPTTLYDLLCRNFRLLGSEGLVLMAIAAIDMAAWDAAARTTKLPLAKLLGASPARIPAYASLRNMKPDDLAKEAESLLPSGFRAFKFKIGWPDLDDDLAAIRALRAVVGDGVEIMVDFNQSLSVADAKRRIRALEGLGIAWVEEPTLMTDLVGQSEIRRVARIPIQAGENWWGPPDAARSIAAGATDLVMADLMKIGGVTGWLRTAALAEAAGLPLSSHIFPEVSAHCLAATPTAHWLEYLDLAGSILAEPLTVSNGYVTASDQPGSGVAWNEKAIAKYAT